MSAPRTAVDLDDTDGLLEADTRGLLRATAMAGAQVRASASAVAEGALDSVTGGARPRTLIWLAGRGAAESAGAVLAAAFGGAAGEPLVLAAESPPWVGPLDAVVVAGDDPGDPALVAGAATAARRGARVIVVAPYEGPLRDATAGRVAVLEPRVWVPGDFGFSRYLGAGLAAMTAVDAAIPADLAALADDLDAEALRNSAAREVFTNPAKALAERLRGRRTVLAGDSAATLALARHGAAVLLRIAGETACAVGLADALVALREGPLGLGSGTPGLDALFHDEQIDGPLPSRPRVIALTTAEDRQVVSARVTGLDDVDLLGAGDIGPEASGDLARPEHQLAVLALRLEMAAVYLLLAGG